MSRPRRKITFGDLGSPDLNVFVSMPTQYGSNLRLVCSRADRYRRHRHPGLIRLNAEYRHIYERPSVFAWSDESLTFVGVIC
jgi:hypothetical protein